MFSYSKGEGKERGKKKTKTFSFLQTVKEFKQGQSEWEPAWKQDPVLPSHLEFSSSSSGTGM
jgi:hypothetical protein